MQTIRDFGRPACTPGGGRRDGPGVARWGAALPEEGNSWMQPNVETGTGMIVRPTHRVRPRAQPGQSDPRGRSEISSGQGSAAYWTPCPAGWCSAIQYTTNPLPRAFHLLDIPCRGVSRPLDEVSAGQRLSKRFPAPEVTNVVFEAFNYCRSQQVRQPGLVAYLACCPGSGVGVIAAP